METHLLARTCTPTFPFRCPITKSPVHGIVVQETPSDDTNSYVSVNCLACAQIHLVNLKTGKTVGEERKG
jgi:hypothetical protein